MQEKQEKQEKPALIVIKGYLYIAVQSITIPSAQSDITCHLSLGLIAKCNTTPSPSAKVINQVFLIQVPEDPSRLALEFKEGEKFIGDCRFDVTPFFKHLGFAHSIKSDIYNNSSELKGTVNTKLTYYSAEFGKLKLRVFHLQLIQPFVQKFKVAFLKVKNSVFAQSSPQWQMDKPFDHDFQLLILQKNGNLQFQVYNGEGVLAKYVLNDLQQSGLMIGHSKAYQVNLFNSNKVVGSIKYQVDWLH